MRYGHLSSTPRLPFTIFPSDSIEGSYSGLIDVLTNDRAFIDDQLLRFGAVLLRGFALEDDAAFERIAAMLEPELKNYTEGNSPRTALSSKVYTSTEYPETEFITLHNELSYTHAPPRHLFFYCHVAPPSGGETPIADCRRVLERLAPEIVQRFAERGVCYIQNMHPGHGLGRSWQQTFETDDKSKVETWLREGDVDFEWKPDGGLWTCQVRPAIVPHPVSGHDVWFNQADQWHVSSLNEAAQAAIRAAYEPDEYPLHVLHGDGSDIDETDLVAVKRAFEEEMVAFPWQRGDLLLIDNYRVAHGRNPFRGPRAIRVAMG